MQNRQTRYLSLLDVLALHAAVMERTGSAPAHLRSEGLLESAIMRPQTAAYYEQADLVRQAALLAAGIAQAQAFVDGNKRTALAAADVFLRLNGYAITAEPLEIARRIEGLGGEGNPREKTARLESWLRECTAPV